MTFRGERARVLALSVGAAGVGAALISCGGGGGGSAPVELTKAQLGQQLFFDTTLSAPKGMSCATCHNPAVAFTDARPGPPTSRGIVAGLFGFRNAPSIKYMSYSPTFSVGSGEGGGAIGGQFWDGRAPDLESQAKFPLVNHVEMNNASLDNVVQTVQNGPSAVALKALYGPGIFNNSTTAINAIVDAIATFERTPAISPFTSKYDAFLAGKAQLTAAETRGLAAFNGAGGCSGCHTSAPLPDGTPPLFTNFCYANLGLPKNPNNPYYTMPTSVNPLGANFVDHGLMVTTSSPADDGNFMTPSLRNVAITPPYFHNGIFATLSQVVSFYNTRDSGAFGPPEVPATEDMTELGNLGLTAQQQADIVTFLQTLTDGYTPTPSLKLAKPPR